ncbi:hypothetical protein LINPERHAP1_LOCUS8449, partial [Linum perenne]
MTQIPMSCRSTPSRKPSPLMAALNRRLSSLPPHCEEIHLFWGNYASL